MPEAACSIPQVPPAKPSPEPGALRWSGKTRGGQLGNWCVLQLIRFCGLKPAYALLVFVAAYFTLASPTAARASVDYLRRVLGPRSLWKWPLLVYRHFYSFGVLLVDRMAVLMGRTHLECSFEGESMFTDFIRQGKGILLVGAHVGAWEIGGQLLGRLGVPVNLIVLEREQERIRRMFDQALDARRFRVLTADANPLRSVPILAALRRGEIVALHGDRALGGAVSDTQFLGGTARLPWGAYALAAVSGAPVFQVFVVREKLGKYRFFTFPPRFVPRGALRESPSATFESCVAEYAARLESVLRQYPFQWCNFYPFWEPPAAPRPASQSPA